jgi:release factor glutamine methyltransferase
MTLRAVVARGRDALVTAGIPPDDAWRDAVVLARSVLGWCAADWLTRSHEAAAPAFTDRFLPLIDRRAGSEPVAYLTGEREFYGRPFKVTRDVLIPRPETELIVDEALRCLGVVAAGFSRAGPVRSPLIADIGTGSGCLAVTLALECPSARVIATDLSQRALEVAKDNARRLDAADRITFRHGSYLAGAAGPIDLIVTNPPYVAEADRTSLPRDVADYEPAQALFGGVDGLAVIRELLPAAAAALAPEGWLVMEIGQGQVESVRALTERTEGLTFVRVRLDLQQIPRVIVARRVRDRPPCG